MRRRQKTVVLTVCGPNVPFEISRGYLQSFGRHVISTRGWKHFSHFVSPDPQSSLNLYLCIDYTRPGCTQSSKSKTSPVPPPASTLQCVVSPLPARVWFSVDAALCGGAPCAGRVCAPVNVAVSRVCFSLPLPLPSSLHQREPRASAVV